MDEHRNDADYAEPALTPSTAFIPELQRALRAQAKRGMLGSVESLGGT